MVPPGTWNLGEEFEFELEFDDDNDEAGASGLETADPAFGGIDVVPDTPAGEEGVATEEDGVGAVGARGFTAVAELLFPPPPPPPMLSAAGSSAVLSCLANGDDEDDDEIGRKEV